VLINDIRFKTSRSINWDDVEAYLKEYIGNVGKDGKYIQMNKGMK